MWILLLRDMATGTPDAGGSHPPSIPGQPDLRRALGCRFLPGLRRRKLPWVLPPLLPAPPIRTTGGSPCRAWARMSPTTLSTRVDGPVTGRAKQNAVCRRARDVAASGGTGAVVIVSLPHPRHEQGSDAALPQRLARLGGPICGKGAVDGGYNRGFRASRARDGTGTTFYPRHGPFREEAKPGRLKARGAYLEGFPGGEWRGAGKQCYNGPLNF